MAPGLGLRAPGAGYVALTNVTRGAVLADKERWAVTPADRARGLLDTAHLAAGEALVISPCNSVHMFGMRYALDVVFVDRAGVVVRAIENLRPMRFTRVYLRAKRVVELPTGVIAASGTRAGDRLNLGEVPEDGAGNPLVLWAVLFVVVAAATILIKSIA